MPNWSWPGSVLPNWSWPGSGLQNCWYMTVYIWCIPTHTMISWGLDQVGEFLDISPHSCLFHGYSVFKQGVVIQENELIHSFSWITTPCLNTEYPWNKQDWGEISKNSPTWSRPHAIPGYFRTSQVWVGIHQRYTNSFAKLILAKISLAKLILACISLGYTCVILYVYTCYPICIVVYPWHIHWLYMKYTYIFRLLHV